MELRSAIGSAFGVELTSTFAFDYPTQAAMAAYIMQAIALQNAHPTQAMVWKWTPGCLQVAVMKLALTPCCMKQARENNLKAAPSEGVCQLVGLSSRFPTAIQHSAGAHSALPGASLFWHNQVVGCNLTATVPYDRWDVDAAYAPNGGAGKAYGICVL